MTPKLLSKEELAEAFKNVIASNQPRAHWRDVIEAHIAALEADNAKLVEFFELAEASIRDGDLGVVVLLALSVMKARHPGAALLEEHRKALASARNEGLERAKATASKLQDEFRSEEANAQRHDSSGSTLHGWRMAVSAVGDVVDAIAALKEPEE